MPLARPRLGKHGVYDPQKNLKKKFVADLLRQKSNWEKIHGAVGVYFEFRMPIPKTSKKRREETLKAHHIKRPDLSNMIKFAEDAMNGHLYDDDSQIVEITAKKVNALVAETIIHIWSQNDTL